MVAVVRRLHRMKCAPPEPSPFLSAFAAVWKPYYRFLLGFCFVQSLWPCLCTPDEHREKQYRKSIMWIYLMEDFPNDKKNYYTHTSNLYFGLECYVSPVVGALYQPQWMWAAGWSPHGPAVFVWFDPAAPGSAAPMHSPCPWFHHSSFWADCSDPGGENVIQKPIKRILNAWLLFWRQ